jgi:hypothetical protein
MVIFVAILTAILSFLAGSGWGFMNAVRRRRGDLVEEGAPAAGFFFSIPAIGLDIYLIHLGDKQLGAAVLLAPAIFGYLVGSSAARDRG